MATTTTDWIGEHTQQTHRNTPHGQKRKAEDEFESKSNISAHFKKLRLKNVPSRPFEVPFRPNQQIHQNNQYNAEPPTTPPEQNLGSSPSISPRTKPPHHRTTSMNEDIMPVDENPNLIVINDLDAEIAAIEADEAAAASSLVHPDFDKQVSAIPQELLQQKPQPQMSTALILYKDPISISVPEEEDAVRRSIIDARRRVRERNALNRAEQRREGIDMLDSWQQGGTSIHEPEDRMPIPYDTGIDPLHYDPDAMEIE